MNKTVSVDKSKLHVYWKRFEECYNLAQKALDSGHYVGSCILLVHGAISLADYCCIKMLGLRHAGTNHSDTLSLYSRLPIKHVDFKSSIARLGKIISLKNMAEYDDQLIHEKDATTMFKDLTRFRDFIQKVILK